MPIVVAGLIAGIFVFLGVAVLGDLLFILELDSSHTASWAPVHLAAAVVAFLLVAVLGHVLHRQFAQLRSLSEDLRRGEEKFRVYAELGSDWFWETDRTHRFVEIAGAHRDSGVLPVDRVLGRSRMDLVREGKIVGDLDLPHWRQHVAALEARLPFHNFVYAIGDGERFRRSSSAACRSSAATAGSSVTAALLPM